MGREINKKAGCIEAKQNMKKKSQKGKKIKRLYRRLSNIKRLPCWQARDGVGRIPDNSDL